MSPSARNLSPSKAAATLGVSAKALRLYEQHGLIMPGRTSAGWRVYGPAEMTRATEIVSLRALGLSLAQVARVLDGDSSDLDAGLAAHEARLRVQAQAIAAALEKVGRLRSDISLGEKLQPADLARIVDPGSGLSISFDLPWPWGGEPFALRDIPPLTYITGPLGSGKTRLAERLAETLPNAAFIGLDRVADDRADPALRIRVEQALTWLVEDGAAASDALTALVMALEADGPDILVIDMVEQGLDQATQEALIAHLRLRMLRKRALFLLTRSSSILDLDAVGSGEAIILCPANHSPPICVAPYPGTPGYEAVSTCLAPPEVRARTAGIIAIRRG